MAYGHRLNAEDVFFRMAEEHFDRAERERGRVQDTDGEGTEDLSFEGYNTENGLAFAAIAVVGWAIGVEAFVNLVWNKTMASAFPSKSLSAFSQRALGVSEKAKETLKFFGEECGDFAWWSDLKTLFSTRNALVHFKDEVSYQGFSFAAPIQKMLRRERCLSMRKAAVSLIRVLGEHTGERYGFVDGDYLIERVEE